MRMGVPSPAGGRRMMKRPPLLFWISPTRAFKIKLLLAFCVAFVVVLITGIVVSAAMCPNRFAVDVESPPRKEFTVLINTFKRNDLLKRSVDHYTSCTGVDSIRVIWSELEPPSDALLAYLRRVARRNARGGKIVQIKFDLNAEDSLNNRFKDIEELTTDAVFSVDDDILVPCASMGFAFHVWQSAPAAMVGFVPRMHWGDRTKDGEGRYRYGGWWSVWWTGTYSMVLTKAAFFHRKYLELYTKHMPAAIRDYVTNNRNCEDIAMSFLVANQTAGPPLWVKAYLQGSFLDFSGSGLPIFIVSGARSCRGDKRGGIGRDQQLGRAYGKEVAVRQRLHRPLRSDAFGGNHREGGERPPQLALVITGRHLPPACGHCRDDEDEEFASVD